MATWPITPAPEVELLELTLATPDPLGLTQFYAHVLGLERQGPLHLGALHRHDGRPGRRPDITLSAGDSRLGFVPGPADARYHFAFNVPAQHFIQAKAWLAERVPLVCADRQDEFIFESWQARAVYFRDPAGNIAELIAREALPVEGDLRILSVSEIGLPTSQPQELSRSLIHDLGLPVFRQTLSPGFAALGDETGLLIVVSEGREWHPSTGVAARPQPLELCLRHQEKTWRLTCPPYRWEPQPQRAEDPAPVNP